ncbi:MAG: N-6 DNA methylase [Kofleriaceae bacterium]|nr:N-6 DNA methylase [Kofleriaceae bacterium]
MRQMQQEFDQSAAVDPGGVGRLYERDLAGDKAQQRASGSYFTPDYLVDFVVQHTLAPLLTGLSAGQIRKLRIIDPSCGAGAFLLGVLRYLEAHCVSLGEQSGPELRGRLSPCLVGVDIDANAISLARATIQLAIVGDSDELNSVSPSAICGATLIVGDALCPLGEVPAVDAIVGNPPWGQKGLSLSMQKRARYKELFKCAKGTWDPFKLFVERCHQLLADGGRWGLVLPDIVLLKNLEEVREVILQGSAMEEIAHCGRVFDGANIDAVAIVAERKCPREVTAPPEYVDSTIRIWPELPSRWQCAGEMTHSQEQSVFAELPGRKFNLYLHGEALAMYRRLLPLQRLGEILDMHEGVHTGNCRKKLFVAESHSDMCKPVIVGRKEFSAYQLKWAGTWLDTSPRAVDRSSGEYANLGRAQWHGPGKIVVRRTGDTVIAAFDDTGYFVSNNLFVLNHSRKLSVTIGGRRAKAIVALLNSRFMTWYFRAIQPRKGRLFAELKLTHLRSFPIPAEHRWTKIEKRLALLAEQGHAQGPERCADQVNELVESAFEVSPQELEVIKLLV